ncbi:STAS domain-containing protein [Roseisalinus antarcticus]|uniref:MlaB-like STAS domain-containing protein n=1 Tax=Roseisalinus antarcticus TaxID=254357 RepID=A0A1Y5SVA9_9RHOB|nr:STAS domain-containing protein [Roseisalinus antarcticus]SLN49149.1 hypothetical protein ROA7023_02106 [Roseisalinus antarcticus]
MDDQCEKFELPPTANHEACAALHGFLAEARGKPVVLDGAKVRRTSARMGLMLLSARRAWSAEGQDFDIQAPSDGLASGLMTLGLSRELIEQEAAA